MLSRPKYVKKASSFIVTERDGDANAKNSKQIQHWFPTLEEAQLFFDQNLTK